MSRKRRRLVPGGFFHLISRFADKRFRLTSPDERRMYLALARRTLTGADWRPIAYALMSSHVHWLLAAGEDPAWKFVQPLHTSFAYWINQKHRRLGPVFAGRFALHFVPSARIAETIAYIHNNPVRAGLCHSARDSDWTSHRAYINAAPTPKWLDVALGKAEAGVSDVETFETFVENELLRPRERRLLGPRTAEDQAATVLVTDIKGRVGDSKEARRIAYFVWVRLLGRPQANLNRAYEISEASGCRLTAQKPTRLELAREIAREHAANVSEIRTK